MASTTLTGSYSGSNASNYGIRCVCSSTSNGSTANTSNVTVTLQMRRAVNTGYEGQWSADGTAKGRIIINGSDSGTSSVYFDTRDTLDWITLKTYTVNNIAHNADGSKSITVTAYFEPNTTSSLYGGYVSGTFVLDTIPRATTPTLSATSVTMGNSVTININPASSGFKHKVRYSFGSLSGQTSGLSVGADFTDTGNTTVTFTPPTSLGSQIPNANSGTCTIYCYTYNSSGTQIGNTTSKTITLNIPSYTPTGSISITGNNLRGTAYVQGKSTVTGNITFSTSYGATIKSVVSTVDGKEYTSSPFTSSVLSAGSKSVSVVITDSRNKTKTVTSSAFTVYEYANPYITTFEVERQSDGTTVIATLIGGVSSINSQNTKAFNVTLNGVTNTITSTDYTVNGTTTFTNVPTDNTLTATATITDYYGSVSKNITLPTVEVTLDFLADGKGIAMGKVAETTDLFDVAWNERVRKNLTVDGNLTVSGKTLLNLIYPVGSIYMSINSASPQTLFGGTWEQLKDTFILAAGDTYAAGSTGGEATHTLIVNEMPDHGQHLYASPIGQGSATGRYLPSGALSSYGSTGRGWYSPANGEYYPAGTALGGGKAHNNMPPYLAVYMWKRTA